MYVPTSNAVDDSAAILELLRRAGVGHLVSGDADGTFDATVLPFLVDNTISTIRAHIARANPQWRALDGAPVLLLVPVSDAYVSPGWYPSKAADPEVVPTWNYEVVHVHGHIRVRDDAGFVESVVRDLTERHEASRREWDTTPDWSVDDAPVEFIARKLRAIVGVELVVEQVDAKRKLSQNRTVEDQQGVRSALAGSRHPRDIAVADAMGARNQG